MKRRRKRQDHVYLNADSISIKQIEGKGLGVVAAKSLLPGAFLFYPSVEVLSVEEEQKLSKKGYGSDMTIKFSYLCQAKDVYERTVYLNAHPAFKPPACSDSEWTGAFINKATKGTNQKVNCDMMWLRKRFLPGEFSKEVIFSI